MRVAYALLSSLLSVSASSPPPVRDAGTYSSVTGMTACTSCGLGAVAPRRGLTACELCQPGFRSDSTTVCSPCPVGSFSADVGAVECSACPAGTIAPAQNSSACVPCAKGSYYAASTQTCVAAVAGFYVSEAGSTQTSPCDAGTFSSEVSDRNACSAAIP